MGLRTPYTAIQPLSAAVLRSWLAEAVASMPGPDRGPGYRAVPRDYWAVHLRDTLTLTDDAWALAREAAARHNLLHLELRAEDDDHWDFTLERAGSIIADRAASASASAPRIVARPEISTSSPTSFRCWASSTRRPTPTTSWSRRRRGLGRRRAEPVLFLRIKRIFVEACASTLSLIN